MSTMPIIIGVAFGCWLAERLWPAQHLPKVRAWIPRIILINLIQLGVVVLAGKTWDLWLEQRAIFHLSDHFGTWAQAGIAYFVSSVIYYGWHRFRHESRWFWNIFHQIHHSPRRIELITSFYKHPVEILANSFLSAAIVFLLLGVTPQAGALYTLFTALAEFFYHWNISTPAWMGYLIQRPESHRIHHQYRRHTKNFGDLPFLDMLFGTFQNGREAVRCGFEPWQEDRLEDMLLFRNVSSKEADARPPLHLLPTCIGCSKRWACQSAREDAQNSGGKFGAA